MTLYIVVAQRHTARNYTKSFCKFCLCFTLPDRWIRRFAETVHECSWSWYGSACWVSALFCAGWVYQTGFDEPNVRQVSRKLCRSSMSSHTPKLVIKPLQCEFTLMTLQTSACYWPGTVGQTVTDVMAQTEQADESLSLTLAVWTPGAVGCSHVTWGVSLN